MRPTGHFLVISLAAFGVTVQAARGASLETQSNPVANGAIVALPGDPDRTDWNAVPAYQADVDAVLPVLSWEMISIAHDDTNLSFRLQMDSSEAVDPPPVDFEQSFFGAHHEIYIDIDQDRGTGYIGGDGDTQTDDSFMAIGADYLIQGPALFKFGNLGNPGGANQELFSWGVIVPFGFMAYDDAPDGNFMVTDIELQFARSDIEDPPAFDWVANTTDRTFANQDQYPNNAFAGPPGAPLVAGDANNDAAVTADDLIAVQQNFGNVGPVGDGTDPGDANDDGTVTADDLISVQQNFGNVGLAGGDFFTYVIAVPASPGVPEPGTVLLLATGALALVRRGAH